MSAARLAALRFAVVFVGLFIITLPFPYEVLPDIGGYLAPCSSALARWVGDRVLHIAQPYTAAIVSDSTGMYIHAGTLLVIAAAVAGGWSVLDRKRSDHPRLRELFHTAVSYYVALQLFKYGVDKLFKSQFYLPEPNTLLTPLGALTRDILYWSTLGASYSYTVAAGLLELVPAVLLLFRRTRLLGAMIAIGVVGHIVLINLAFDISVKLYSCFLFLLCLIVAAPALGKMYALLARNRRVDPLGAARDVRSEGRVLLYAVVKAVVIMAIVFEALFIYFRSGSFNDDQAPRPFLHGAYDVEMFVRNGDTIPPLLTDSRRPRRIFIHRRGYFITQSMDDAMRDYRLDHDSAGRRLILHPQGAPVMTLGYDLAGNDSLLTLHGVFGGDSVALRARRIDLDRLPLLRRSFHWTIDGYR